MFLINFHILTCLLLLNGNFLKTQNLSKSPGTHAYNSWQMYACGLSFSVKTHISQPVIMEKHWIMGQKVWIWGWFSTNKILYRGNQSIVVPHLWNSWLSWPRNCENHMKLYNKQYKYKRLSPTKYKIHSSIYHFKVHLLKAYNEQTKQNCLCLLKRKMSGSLTRNPPLDTEYASSIHLSPHPSEVHYDVSMCYRGHFSVYSSTAASRGDEYNLFAFPVAARVDTY